MLVYYLVCIGFFTDLVEKVFELVSDCVDLLADFVYLGVEALLRPW